MGWEGGKPFGLTGWDGIEERGTGREIGWEHRREFVREHCVGRITADPKEVNSTCQQHSICSLQDFYTWHDIILKKYKKLSSCEIEDKISSKLICASCVISDRAYYWVCVLMKDIGWRLPLELHCSLYQGQQGDNQSVRGNYKPHTCTITITKRRNPAKFARKYSRYYTSAYAGYLVRHHMIRIRTTSVTDSLIITNQSQ